MSFPKQYSFNTKVLISFILLGFILLAILFVQIIPNMQEEQKKVKKNQIEHMISLTNEQLKLAVQLLLHSRNSKINSITSEIDSLLDKYQIEYKTTNEILRNLNAKESCSFYSKEEALNKISKRELSFFKKQKLIFYHKEQKHMCPKQVESFFYNTQLENGKDIYVMCKPIVFESKHISLESKIKKDLQNSFKLTRKDHKGKINLIWINKKHKGFEKEPLFNTKDKPFNEKYCLSKMSSLLIPQTGTLSGKQIIEASNKEPIFHILDGKNAYTWVKTINVELDNDLYFLTTIFEEDINKHLTSSLLKVFPPAVLSLVLAIVLGFFIFKKLFKSINILTNTVKQINEGKIDLRSGLKGDDDIALLGKSFDKMLDSLEENIKTLDNKVEAKTKELSESLSEKEVLLKEVHHRVKNNLAMTINLIKLQKKKLDDEKTKEALVDIQERIFTMELLHRKLYESKDLSSISFKKYVSELCEDLHNTYNNNEKIKLQVDIDDSQMSIDFALPCGLIITECLINAYKYAFESSSGLIYVEFRKKQNHCTLKIKDNGIGLPKNININKTKSLGLRLVSSIVKGQLLGSFNYVYDEGAKFLICFEMKEN